MKKFTFLIILLLLLPAVSNNLFSQTKDTLWTRDVWPLYVINGVFSPDDQFIYATGASDSYGAPPYTVLKYDLQGNLLSKIDSVGGIRQFSEDGRFFWNYYGDKYDANTFQRTANLIENLNLLYLWPHPNYWKISINEKSDIGIAVTDQGIMKNEQFRSYFDSNLVIFKPSEAKLNLISSYPTKTFRYYAMGINPSGTEVAFLLCNTLRDSQGNNYSDTNLIEIWNIQSWKKVNTLNIAGFKTNQPQQLILKYSPDGSVLGYQHDGKLTLYSTTDYSVVWENEELQFGRIQNFIWSKDNNYLYISFYTNKEFMGICKLKFSDKSIIKLYPYSSGTSFINFSENTSFIITHWGNSLELLDNTLTSVRNPFLEEDYKINLVQNQAKNNYYLTINAVQPNLASYTITNSLGKMQIQPISLNLEQGFNQFEINTSNLPSGVYFLNLTIDNHTHSVKFIVVR